MQAYQPYFNYFISCIAALAICLFSIPNIIYVSKRKRLFDLPDNERKLHKRIVPNLGGVGIFFAFIITTSLFIKPANFPRWNYINAALLILFVTGIKDDLVQISPSKKLIAQLAAALITVCFADIRLHSLHGFLGIGDLPIWISIPFSVVGCVFVTNAFNLIDGIDGLAGTIGIFICFVLGVALALEGLTSEAIVAFSMVGALIGFLRYNISPAKIFMGDTGSLIIGFTVAILGILFINGHVPGTAITRYFPAPHSSLVIALAVLFIPVFDTFRVFIMRTLRGHSPFRPDRTHLHHYVLDLGYTHTQAVGIILVANVLIVSVSFTVQRFNINIAIGCLLFVASALYAFLLFMRRSRGIQSAPLLTGNGLVTAAGTNNLDGKHADGNGLPAANMKHTSVIVNGKKIVIDEPEEVMTSE